jgi:hypothetical protein
MNSHDWLEVVRREYLQDFVHDGGAAVKFVVPAGRDERERVRDGLRRAAEQDGYQFAAVDAESTRMHLIEQLYFAVARQLDWDALSRAFLVRSLAGMDIGSRQRRTPFRWPRWRRSTTIPSRPTSTPRSAAASATCCCAITA